MDVYGTKQIRNVVLLGHGGAESPQSLKHWLI